MKELNRDLHWPSGLRPTGLMLGGGGSRWRSAAMHDDKVVQAIADTPEGALRAALEAYAMKLCPPESHATLFAQLRARLVN